MKARNKGIMISYVKIAVNMICGMVLSSTLLKQLGDTEYGIYQTVSAFANYLILLEFGVGTVMIRNISMCRGHHADQEEIQRNISTTWTLTCLLSVLLVAVSALFYCLIPLAYANAMTPSQIQHGQNIFLIIVVYLLLNFLLHTVNAVIFSFEDYTYGSLQSIWRTLLRCILLIVLLQWLQNAIVVAAVDLLISAVCLVSSLWYCRKRLKVTLHFGKCDPVILRASVPLAVAVFLQGIVSQANNNVDKFLIGILLSPESVSLYSVALYIYSIFCSLSNVASSMYVPVVTQHVGRGLTGRELSNHLITPCRLTALFGGLVLFGFVAVGRQFVEILYTKAYLAAWPMAIILIAPTYLDTVVEVLVYVLDAMNKRMVRSIVLIVTTIMNILLTIFCLNHWGVFSAAVATAVCTLIGPVFFMGIYYHRVLRIPVLWLFRQAFRGILIYLVVGCCTAMGVSGLFENVYASFIAGGLCFVLIVLGGYFLFGMNEAEKITVRKFAHRITEKCKKLPGR